MPNERVEATEIVEMMLKFGEALADTVYEKETAGEISTEEAIGLYFLLSEWRMSYEQLYQEAQKKKLLDSTGPS